MDLNTLLQSLSIEEKIGQLVMIAPFFFIKGSDHDIAGPLSDLGLTQEQIYQTGSVLGIGNADEMIRVQEKYLEKSRHKIPLIFMADIIHGYETIFPVPLGLASSFNDDILYSVARTSAIEASSAGIHITFAPMVDLVRDPRWGRVVESFGEDPYMAQRFAKVQVKGYQNGEINQDGNIGSCVKHFAAYGLAEAGKDYNTVDLSRLNLHQNYLRGFKGAIDAGAKLVMTAFNIFEGIPATVNKYLLKDVLRGDLNFKGVVISDYASLKETITHGIAADSYDAAIRGIKAGLNIEMATAQYMKHLKDAVAKGDITIEAIDEMVMDVLKLKQDAGLFDNPFKGASKVQEQTLVRSKKHLNEALKAAEESIVMLKNDNIFPLNQSSKIALIGRYANKQELNGPWSWHGSKHRNQTLYDVFSKDMNIHYMYDGEDVDFDKLNEVDIILIAAGENERDSGEAHAKSNIKIPYGQETWIQNIKKHTTKKIGLLLFNGRPLDLTDVVDHVDGLLECFFPGSMGAQAISNILTGKVNPSAKLTMSFPRSVGQIPVYYNHLNTGRPYDPHGEYTSFYLDLDHTPLFSFGYGLSYSNFKYDKPILSKDTMHINETIELSIDVTNTSNIEGKEIIQLYLRDHVAEVSRPVKELMNFKKVCMKAKEKLRITFEITQKDLRYIGPDLKSTIDSGTFSLMVGPNSNDLQTVTFKLNIGGDV